MIILGLLMVAAAVAAAIAVVAQNRTGIDVHAFGNTWHVPALWLAVAGAALLLTALVGLSLMRAGAGRSRRIRRERRHSASERRDLAEENRRLSERAERAEATPAQSAVPADQNHEVPSTGKSNHDAAAMRHQR